jgi:hypothetical protein
METIITLKITHAKPLPDLADKAAGRIYTMDGIDDVVVVTQATISKWVPALPELPA